MTQMIRKQLVINQPFMGKLIRELRQEIGLTQEQFAAELGVTCSSVNRWENGRSKPLPLAMEKILEMLEQMSDSPDATFRDRAQELLNRHSEKQIRVARKDLRIEESDQ